MDRDELLELMRTDPEIRGAIIDAIFDPLMATVARPAELADHDRQDVPPDAIGGA